ncbi:MAG: threo-3-hydroxy-L-aspartate ammonia-lyase [Phycisphaerales bacterium JB059]
MARVTPTDLTPDPALADAVTLDDVRDAGKRLAGVARRTPVMTSRALDEALRCSVFLKCENLQRVGAFKFRGAYNALSLLDDDARRAGALVYSSGNHAQGIACAAAILGIPATIVMPSNAPRVKRVATEGYLARAPRGSRVVEYDPATQVREELGASIALERGLTVIPPYDHPHVIAGQGTVALELHQQAAGLDEIYVCCGGGGVLSGCAIATRGVQPGCRVIGVEPEAGDDATRSFRTGRLHEVRNPETIADGARTPRLGRYTFPMVRRHVDEMLTVSDAELARWTLWCMERLRVVVEPTGVLGLAGLARRAGQGLAGARVGVVLTGGNLDLSAIASLRRLAGETV